LASAPAGGAFEFDYVAGLPGPWVTRDKYRLIERFKFFQNLAWKPARRRLGLLQRMARFRLSRDEYRWPLEMRLLRQRGPRLS